MEDLIDEFGVEGAGGLVVEHDFRLHGEGAGDGGALLLAAGEVRGVAVPHGREADLAEEGAAGFFGILARDAADEHRGEHGVLDEGAVGEEVELLENHADALAQGVEVFRNFRAGRCAGLARDGGACGRDGAGVEEFEAVDAAEHGALAAARGADDRDEVAFLEGKAHALQHGVVVVAFPEVRDGDDGGGWLGQAGGVFWGGSGAGCFAPTKYFSTM